MPFSLGQIIFGVILLAVGAIVATEANRNNLLTPSNTSIPAQNAVTATPLATNTPTKQTNPVPATIGNTANSEQVINCNFPHSGTLRVTQSKCDAMTDCEISSGKWQAVWKTDCDALLKNQAKEKTSTPETVVPKTTDVYVPIFVSTRTLSCQKNAVNAIQDIEEKIKQELSDDSDCNKKELEGRKKCLSSCQDSYSSNTSSCSTYAPSGYTAYLEEAGTKSASCRKSCYEDYGQHVCDRYSSVDYYYDQLEKLTSQYCK